MEKKNVTNLAHLCLEIWNVGWFLGVWLLFYNGYAFNTYGTAGALVTILLYIIVYNALCHIYKAFRIASSPIGETVFSQMISFGITDLIFYIQCCLIFNHYVNIWPGVCTVGAQILGTAIIITGFKNYFMKHVAPQKTMLVYGMHTSISEAEAFQQRILEKYSHLFDIVYIDTEEEAPDLLKRRIQECGTVLLYELSPEKRTQMSDWCMNEKKNLYFTPRIGDIILQGCSTKHLLDTPLMKYDYAYQNQVNYCIKRVWDIVLSLVMVVLTSPIMLLTAIAIKLEDHGPVFFKQERCTKDAKVFNILKFRSMIVDAEKEGVIPCQAHDSRITKVGRLIRATRIDELPQLLNILKGDMSFVGPRPERVEHVEQYMKEVPEFAYRMRVKGGLTGYAQIFGKYNTSAYDKIRLDMMYIENQSFLLDMKLLLLTFRTIFTPESTEGFSEEKSKAINQKEKRMKKVSERQLQRVKLNQVIK